MQYTESFIERIREETDLVALVGSHVELKKAGKEFKGRCPFHEEKSASFSVNPSKNVYGCFGCGAGGNSISFISKKEGLSFPDTIKFIAEFNGWEPEFTESSSKKTSEQSAFFREVKESLNLALEIVRKPVMDNYLRPVKALSKLPLSMKTLHDHKFGFIINEKSPLSIYSRKLKQQNQFAAANLITIEKGQMPVDSFSGQACIPVMSGDNVEGYIGFSLNDPKSKQLSWNSNKSMSSSAGIDLAKQHIEPDWGMSANENEPGDVINQSLLVVSTPWELLAMHDSGIKNTVCTPIFDDAQYRNSLIKLCRLEKPIVFIGDLTEAQRHIIESLEGQEIKPGYVQDISWYNCGDGFSFRGVTPLDASIRIENGLTSPLEHAINSLSELSSLERKSATNDLLSRIPESIARSIVLSQVKKIGAEPAKKISSTQANSYTKPTVKPASNQGSNKEDLLVASIISLPGLAQNICTGDIYSNLPEDLRKIINVANTTKNSRETCDFIKQNNLWDSAKIFHWSLMAPVEASPYLSSTGIKELAGEVSIACSARSSLQEASESTPRNLASSTEQPENSSFKPSLI